LNVERAGLDNSDNFFRPGATAPRFFFTRAMKYAKSPIFSLLSDALEDKAMRMNRILDVFLENKQGEERETLRMPDGILRVIEEYGTKER
jgi:hypothetical protein